MVRSDEDRARTNILLIFAGVLVLLASVAIAAGATLFRARPDPASESPAQVTRTFVWDGGERLSVGVPGEVRYVPGPDNKVTVTGPQRVVDRMTVRHGAIVFDPWSGRWFGHLFVGGRWPEDGVRIVVTTPRLSDVDVGGAARLELGRLEQDRLTLGVSGAGRADLSGAIGALDVRVSGAGGATLNGLKTERMGATMSGAGWLRASGDCEDLRLQGSGAAHAELGQVGLQDLDADLSGGSSAVLGPRRSAKVSVSGGAHVRLLIQPPHLQVHRSGGGSVAGPQGWL